MYVADPHRRTCLLDDRLDGASDWWSSTGPDGVGRPVWSPCEKLASQLDKPF
jgi:hypothetical protein